MRCIPELHKSRFTHAIFSWFRTPLLLQLQYGMSSAQQLTRSQQITVARQQARALGAQHGWTQNRRPDPSAIHANSSDTDIQIRSDYLQAYITARAQRRASTSTGAQHASQGSMPAFTAPAGASPAEALSLRLAYLEGFVAAVAAQQGGPAR